MEHTMFIRQSFHRLHKIRSNKPIHYRFFVLADHDVTCDVRFCLDTPGSHVAVSAYILALPGARVFFQTSQLHEREDTKSAVTVTAAVGKDAFMSYIGSIAISRYARGANAYEYNSSLLVGKHSQAISKPILEIQTEDVRCGHGSMTSLPQEDQLWYLESRGLSRKEGIRVLLRGLFGDMKYIPLQYQKDWEEGITRIAQNTS